MSKIMTDEYIAQSVNVSHQIKCDLIKKFGKSITLDMLLEIQNKVELAYLQGARDLYFDLLASQNRVRSIEDLS